MVFNLRKLKKRAELLKIFKLELRKDIKRENIENEEPQDPNFRFSALINHIKKNWVDGRS